MASSSPAKTFYSPPEVAKRLGVAPEKITGWIASGELLATDVSTQHGSGRPRWRISETNLEAFLLRRSATPSTKAIGRRRRRDEVEEYV